MQVWCRSVVTTFLSPEDPELYVVANVDEHASEYLQDIMMDRIGPNKWNNYYLFPIPMI